MSTHPKMKSMKPIPHKTFDTPDFRIQVLERYDCSYIATFWDKTSELEVDRRVGAFETFGGALDQAFDWLAVEYKATTKRTV